MTVAVLGRDRNALSKIVGGDLAHRHAGATLLQTRIFLRMGLCSRIVGDYDSLNFKVGDVPHAISTMHEVDDGARIR